MKIEQYLDVDKLIESIEGGWVEKRRHQTLPLSILTYSRKTTYEDHWDSITTKTRGLIVDDDGTIVARPYEKFFNLCQTDRPETWLSNLPRERPVVQEKLDGSLAILVQYLGRTLVASKGSFHSEHANWATEWYNRNHSDAEWPVGYTPVFEMICESVQTHVVYYDLPDHMVLLSLINKETGEEMDQEGLAAWADTNRFLVAPVYKKSLGEVLHEDRPNAEGYVLSWPRKGETPLKVKVKHPSFLTNQKIAHAATPKRILQALIADDADTLKTWQESDNPVIKEFIQKWMADYLVSYSATVTTAKEILSEGVRNSFTRKELADFLYSTQERRYFAPVVWALVDKKDHRKVTWKLVGSLVSKEEDKPAVQAEED